MPSFLRKRAARWALGFALAAMGGCAEPAPDPTMVRDWISLGDEIVRGLDGPSSARFRAVEAITLYESYAADPRSNLRSLAGQVNGLWSVPLPGGAVDAAIVNAEAQRLVLGALLSSESARASVDSLASAHLDARKSAGARTALRERSLAHGAALANAVLLRARQESARTLVLRHAAECRYDTRSRDESISQAGKVAADSAVAESADRMVESFIITAITAADASVSSGGPPTCVRQRVETRLRTR